ncbi:hypothetical protein C8J56DRAFT_798025 [Mycena floridula]|nr:hypothetical protein C8J56DRAFT_798025 [Mycena floridula]
MFPSSSKGNRSSSSAPSGGTGLNATQSRPASHAIFTTIEEELHDARRVSSHGQEEDLRLALNMVIKRVGELSTMLSEAYQAQADLSDELSVCKSNLQLLIANTEMLEEALKQQGNRGDVGWRRGTESGDFSSLPGSPTIPGKEAPLFKFRLGGSRSSTPQNGHHLSSASMPSLPKINQEVDDIRAELEKEKTAHKAAISDKEALEAEIESLSQALFEEANKMVVTERIKRAETEEELKAANSEKEALKSALKLIEGENRDLRIQTHSRSSSLSSQSQSQSRTHSRSSSLAALKSSPSSPEIPTARPTQEAFDPPEDSKTVDEPFKTDPPTNDETPRPPQRQDLKKDENPWAD